MRGIDQHHDDAGNLTRKVVDGSGNAWLYTYDYDNRLVAVDYDPAAGADTRVAAFAYDAMGRVISSQTRYDTDTNAVASTLKYHYDGQEVIAETDESDVMQRRYVHRTRQIDERAIMLSGNPADPPTLDTYYYLVRELGTVAGLIKRNGTLVEANTYDASGHVHPWGYRDFDFNRDGDVDSGDETVFNDAYSGSGNPTTVPTADYDLDGDVDGTAASGDGDWLAFNNAVTGSGEPPITLYTSALGNPYHFTGRRLYMLEDTPADTDPAENLQLQHNRARFYKPEDGRWLNRDPAGYMDGMNLYEYCASRPPSTNDPNGLYSDWVHEHLTREWAIKEGMLYDAANAVAEADDATDGIWTGPWAYIGMQDRHFNRHTSGDSRFFWRDIELHQARTSVQVVNGACLSPPSDAAERLGRALHSVQDWWAHGDYSKGTAPTASPHSSDYYETGRDAYGTAYGVHAYPNGRAPQVFRKTENLHHGTSSTYEVSWPCWKNGPKRDEGAETDSRKVIRDFLDHLRAVGCERAKDYCFWRP